MTDSLNNNESFWKKKIAAFLHDTPEKQFDIVNHEANSNSYYRRAQIATDDETANALRDEIKPCDWFDSSVERFGLPKVKCSHSFTESPLFVHPFSSEKYSYNSECFSNSERRRELEEKLQNEFPNASINNVEKISYKNLFFNVWRRWQENCTTGNNKKIDLGFIPADSRIPDHTIWTHMSMSSAFVDCVDANGNGNFDLLLFQFGPVQDFIAQARSSRDMWSGSYLLSWLAANALKAITDERGPDSIVFPSLRGNGIFDALHKDDVYNTIFKGKNGVDETTWKRILDEKGSDLESWLLNPTLPNRFLAIVPRGKGIDYAKKAEAALNKELMNIASNTWDWIKSYGINDEWKDRFFDQVKAFPQITYAVQPWISKGDIISELEYLSPDTKKIVEDFIYAAEKQIPSEDQDSRFYTNGTLKNNGFLWSAHIALLNAKLAARKNTRNFSQRSIELGSGQIKDSLSGVDESIGDNEFWRNLTGNLTASGLFKITSHRYGAMNLIKRVWWKSYLYNKFGLREDKIAEALHFDSSGTIAGDDKYFAVVALDGDQMGKWMSGENLPSLLDSCAPKAKEYLKGIGVSRDLKRLMTPSYHLQFSEALANYSIYSVKNIVEKYDGALVYSGGDDVLAYLPAKQVFACVKELRDCFKENYVDGRLYPGSKSDVSCGIAVGYEKAPLQMLVKEARRMESVAKNKYARGAFAIALYKRSGEIIEWGSKWDTVSIELMKKLTELIDRDNSEGGELSHRFPYAIAKVLRPYNLEGNDDLMKEIINKEVEEIISRQPIKDKVALKALINNYLESTKDRLEDFVNLFLVEAFINRNREDQ